MTFGNDVYIYTYDIYLFKSQIQIPNSKTEKSVFKTFPQILLEAKNFPGRSGTPSGSENEKLGDRLCLLDARNIACQGGAWREGLMTSTEQWIKEPLNGCLGDLLGMK